MKGKSIIEVLSVFLIFRIIGLWMRTTDIMKWEFETLHWSYIGGALLFIIPLTILFLSKRNFQSYGLTLEHWREDLNFGLIFALITGIFLNGMGYMILWKYNIEYTEMRGALLLTCCWVAALVVVLSHLRKAEKQYYGGPPPSAGMNFVVLIGLLALPLMIALYAGKDITIIGSTVLWQFIFSGVGEEVMYRGYYQSRINEEFGRPFTFMGVHFGYGVIISSLLFSCVHILNPFNPLEGIYEYAWWWGLFTFFGGLTFGLVREKTGSIIPCGIAHGLPDAVGEAFGLLFMP